MKKVLVIVEFDPNKLPKQEPKVPIWATYVPARRPQFKTYHSVGHAKSARKNAQYQKRDGILYELVGGKWIERDRWSFAHTSSGLKVPTEAVILARLERRG